MCERETFVRKFSLKIPTDMPGVLKTKDDKGVAEAIEGPPDPGITNGDSNAEIMPQPRQPTSLHGLLRFAMEATKSEDAPSTSNFQPMDPEVGFLKQTSDEITNKWLETIINKLMQALHSFVVVVVNRGNNSWNKRSDQ